MLKNGKVPGENNISQKLLNSGEKVVTKRLEQTVKTAWTKIENT